MNWLRLEPWLRHRFNFKEIGWEEIGEKFTRFIIFKSRFLSVYVHKLDAPIPHPNCHDHPWHFWSIILRNGYEEIMNGKKIWRGAGSVLYRPALSTHNTITIEGKPMWSLIIISKRIRPWGFKKCDGIPKHV